ncbi:putative sporulation protein YtxC [Paenibacillus mucilaginosus]|uniref:Sporulation protein YtxC n=3 Tax=Paenibacillus mucilaginosus TaxID=61624 RepID=H6NGD1_9BACL|nr:putative sporulation protein YtxC [Paenibacillus mucilaginosus]AEI45280.1 Sporulation protein YtxC [Paenibacillus mucilaginosus KNP414]AFC33013.1 Sporulation protein YtxC [Paenibacillus mucilaginosus 3016]AFH65328.1 sporulation protein [Paenibacillus mucilaginosus K02]MCG7212834.1 putative sporulation protein YtxC [Paenibacillus mucilaginosus]WDM26744.1 putative sporulation protein YtxC [Paenibacillus mucilaginosus]
MKLFTVYLLKRSDAQADRLSRELSGSGDLLHNTDKIHIALNGTEGLHQIEVSGKLPAFQLHIDGDVLLAEAAQVLADYVLREEELPLLRSMIRQEYGYKREEDVSQILSYCDRMLGTEAHRTGPNDYAKAYARRREIIAEELREFLQEQTLLNLDGFLRFRLQTYREELREIVEYAVDEFVMDQQYREFISLLQYFVYIQEAKVPIVHLIHKGGADFLLMNERMELIETEENETVVTAQMLEKDMNFEDMIVSTLITVSPGKIFIHTREPDVQVIHTIRQIFENRVELCGYCRMCHSLDRSTAAEYNKG